MISDLTLYRLAKCIGMPALILVFALSLHSCIKEEFNADLMDPSLQINPGVAAPIGWARYRLDEMLTDSLGVTELIVGPDGFITMRYSQDLYSLQASDLLSIPDIPGQDLSIPNPSPVALDLNLIQGDTTFTDTLDLSLPLNGTAGAEIDSIILSSGTISVSATTQYDRMDWEAAIRIEGVPNWKITLSTGNASSSRSLNGVTLPLDNTPPSSNELSLVVSLTISPSNEILNPGMTIMDFDIDISGLEFSAIYGYLGQFSVNAGPQSFPVNFFSRLSGGTFHFKDPKLTVGFLNSFGLPMQVSMTDFEATGRDGQVTSITGSGVPTPADNRIPAYPRIGQEGQETADSLVMTSSNTNLFTVLESSPVEVSVGVNGTTNPAGVTHDNFIVDDSRLSVSTELLLPFEGYADLLLVADTLDFVFGDYYSSPPEEFIRLIFRLNFDHQFPTDLYIQLNFLDENYNPIDSLFHDAGDGRRIVAGAEDSDGDGIAEAFQPDPVEIELTREQIENISTCQYIKVTGRIRTSGYDSSPPENVKFYSFYYFKAWIGAIAELKINSNDYY